MFRCHFIQFTHCLSCIEEPEQPEQLTPEEIRDQNEEDIQLFVEQNDLDAQSTASGLYYVIDEEGNGTHPTSTDTVTVRYTGYSIYTGQVFRRG